MNLCVIADLHGNVRYSSQLKELEYDVLVICGDITNFGHYKEACATLNCLPEPYIGVHGNCDYPDVLTALDERGCNLHRTCIEIDDECFCGFGGGNRFLGKTPSEYTEEEIYNGLSGIPENCILVTHAPPKKTKVDKVFMKHAGSSALRQIIVENPPKIVLCGHIHEGRNIDHIGDTVIVNPGKFSEGYYATVSTRERKCSLERFR